MEEKTDIKAKTIKVDTGKGVCDSLSCPNSALIFVRQLLISLPQLRLHFRGFLPRIYFTQ